MSAAESLAIGRRLKESFRPRLDVDAVVVVVDCTDCAVVVAVSDGADEFDFAVASVVGEAECDPTHKSGVNILVKLNAGTVSRQL